MYELKKSCFHNTRSLDNVAITNSLSQDLAGFSSCSLTGNSNFRGFSGNMITMRDHCEHVLAKSCEGDDVFELRIAQVRF